MNTKYGIFVFQDCPFLPNFAVAVRESTASRGTVINHLSLAPENWYPLSQRSRDTSVQKVAAFSLNQPKACVHATVCPRTTCNREISSSRHDLCPKISQNSIWELRYRLFCKHTVFEIEKVAAFVKVLISSQPVENLRF